VNIHSEIFQFHRSVPRARVPPSPPPGRNIPARPQRGESALAVSNASYHLSGIAPRAIFPTPGRWWLPSFWAGTPWEARAPLTTTRRWRDAARPPYSPIGKNHQPPMADHCFAICQRRARVLDRPSTSAVCNHAVICAMSHEAGRDRTAPAHRNQDIRDKPPPNCRTVRAKPGVARLIDARTARTHDRRCAPARRPVYDTQRRRNAPNIPIDTLKPRLSKTAAGKPAATRLKWVRNGVSEIRQRRPDHRITM